MRRWLPCLVLVIALLATAGPFVVLEAGRPDVSDPSLAEIRKSLPSELKDQDDYHLPVIETMQAQWPRPDIVHYESATAPGYHLALAAAGQVSPGPKAPMLALNLVFGLAFVVMAWMVAAHFTGSWVALALVAPLAASKYVFAGMIWMTTDNLAWALVAASLGLCLMATTRRRLPVVLIGAGVLAGAAVLTRQIHVWLLAPVGWLGLVHSPLGRRVPVRLRPESPEADVPTSWLPLALGVIGALIPAAAVAILFWLWGGLVPVASDAIAKHAAGANGAAPAFALALTGVLGCAFIGAGWRDGGGGRWPVGWLVLAAAAGVVVAVIPQTDWVRNVRDYGWLWRPVVQSTPAPAGRSVLLTALAGVGAVVLFLLSDAARRRGRGFAASLLLLSMLGWLLAQSANAMAWQRYFEPAVLLALAWLAAMAVGDSRGRSRLLAVGGALALALAEAGLTALLVIRPALAAW
ncbi:MAG: glycosyltransferase family 39 protein [Phycisphaerales bacterium]|nr:glycosyltransferase family 39 protein [Phycisphaerales bacterium]